MKNKQVEGELKFSSLSDQVYAHIRRQMHTGELLPGSTINIGEIAKQLGVSTTPLRDALIHLEFEGFVTILPRKGVQVNRLDLNEVKHAYSAIGLVESHIIRECIDKVKPSHIRRMEELNEIMLADIQKEDFSHLFSTNLQFHHVYLDVSDNETLKKFILPIKHRLYDFPRQQYIKEWEIRNCEEHGQLIDILRQGNADEAARILKDVHWSYEFQYDYICTFYNI